MSVYAFKRPSSYSYTREEKTTCREREASDDEEEDGTGADCVDDCHNDLRRASRRDNDGSGGGRSTDLVATPPRVNRDSKKLRFRPPGFEGTGLSRGRQALGGL